MIGGYPYFRKLPYWEYSSQLTDSYFQRGGEKPPTRDGEHKSNSSMVYVGDISN